MVRGVFASARRLGFVVLVALAVTALGSPAMATTDPLVPDPVSRGTQGCKDVFLARNASGFLSLSSKTTGSQSASTTGHADLALQVCWNLTLSSDASAAVDVAVTQNGEVVADPATIDPTATDATEVCATVTVGVHGSATGEVKATLMANADASATAGGTTHATGTGTKEVALMAPVNTDQQGDTIVAKGCAKSDGTVSAG